MLPIVVGKCGVGAERRGNEVDDSSSSKFSSAREEFDHINPGRSCSPVRIANDADRSRGAEVRHWCLGTVRWFDAAKGFGFIEPDDGHAADVFVEYTSIDMRGFKTLFGGQRVIFTYQTARRGREAATMRPVPERAKPPRYVPMDDGQAINPGCNAFVSDARRCASRHE